MAPLPKRRHSSHRQSKRKRALKSPKIALVKCPNCGSFKIPHRVCPECGYYKGKPVIIKKQKKDKK